MSKIPTEQELQDLFSKPLLKCKELKPGFIKLDASSISLDEFISLANQHANFVFYEYVCFPIIQDIIEETEQSLEESCDDDTYSQICKEHIEKLWNYVGYAGKPLTLCLVCKIEDVFVGVIYSDISLLEKWTELDDCLTDFKEESDVYEKEQAKIERAKACEEFVQKLKADTDFMKLTNQEARYNYVKEKYTEDELFEAGARSKSELNALYTRFLKNAQ